MKRVDLGQRLFEYRKSKHLSQEEVAEQLNVTRQTISKWETNQSTPDFDKIMPICNLYNISADELITGVKKEVTSDNNIDEQIMRKRLMGIIIGSFLYLLAVIWIMISIFTFSIDIAVSIAVALLIGAVATIVIIYVCYVYKIKKENKIPTREEKIMQMISEILAIFFAIVYFAISFISNAWKITWIIWIIYGLSVEVVKLIFMLKEKKNEE